MMEFLNKKRTEVLSAIEPIMKAFNIRDYDYIANETGQTEILRIYDTKIDCSYNSVSAVVDEVIGYIFVKIYCKNRSIGAFKAQTLSRIKEYWIKDGAE
jgi:hypothetical protein